MNYLDVCSGISAPTVAWKPLGWKAAAYAEIEKFPSAVLRHHYPEVKNHGDFTTIKGDEYGAIDLLVGGTPCQDFSVAGLRAGMDGARGQLTIEFARLAERVRPRWLVWENVPGVLSIDGGRAFGVFLGLLGQLGYGFAYRILDAQFFGVPQRRRRVFVVGHLGDWRRAAAVLFERHSLSGYPAPRREAGQSAPTIPARSLGGGGLRTDFDCDGGLLAFGGNNTSGPIDVASACNAKGGAGRMDFESETLIAHSLRGGGFDASEDGTGRETPLVTIAIQGGAVRENPDSGPDGMGVRTDGQAFTLEARSEVQAVMTLAIRGRGDSHNLEYREDGIASAVLTPNGWRAGIGVGAIAQTITADMYRSGGATAGNNPGVRNVYPSGMAIRRLTPRECERLQGFPDDYTKISAKTADGPRYKALGNSMAVPVMRWIGERIQAVEGLA